MLDIYTKVVILNSIQKIIIIIIISYYHHKREIQLILQKFGSWVKLELGRARCYLKIVAVFNSTVFCSW